MATFWFDRGKYDIVIGGRNEQITTARYVFDGWLSDVWSAQFHSSVSELERMTRSQQPPGFLEIREKKGPGERIVEVVYNKEKCNTNDIEEYLVANGAIVRRATPFNKPTKTLWQALRDALAP